MNRKRVPALPALQPKKGLPLPKNWKARYLELLRTHGGFYHCARQLGLDPKTAWRERERDPEFNEACREAREEYADSIEHRMVESAEQSGNPAGFIVRLKALRPQEYIEKHAVLTLSADLNELPAQDAMAVLRGMLGTTTTTTVKMLAPDSDVQA